MNTKVKASPNPGKEQKRKRKETLARGEYRAKTMIDAPLQPGITLPPLSEDITRETASESAIGYAFKVMIHSELVVLVTEQLGQGAMGMVFKGFEEMEDSRGKKELVGEVAVKIIHLEAKDLGSDPEGARSNLYEKFRNEVILLKKLSNDHIVRIDDFGTTESPVDSKLVPFYTMEFLPGSDLEVILKEKKILSWERVKHLILQLCDALEDAHEYEEQGIKKPIIHRDIKPGNVFITTDKRGKEIVKVLDFGIATILGPQKEKNIDQGIWGTLEYMSPEQATGQETDHRTDIYSVGSMMYHLLTGRTTFSQVGSMEDRLKRILNDSPKPMERSGIDFPLEVERIIFKCLEKDPKKRFQSVHELQEAIYKINGQELTSDDPLESQKTDVLDITGITKPKRKRKRLLFGVLASTILLAGAGSVALLSSKKTTENKPAASEQTPDSSKKKPAPTKAPPPEKAIDSGIEQDNQQSIKYYSITLNLNTSGIRATMDGEEQCISSKEKRCTFTLQQGAEPVKITLSKPGYITKTISILPHMNQVFNDQLKKKRRRIKRRKPKTKTKLLITPE
jgi:serine/threonine-protein kinase